MGGRTSGWFSGTEGNASKSSESSNDEFKFELVEDTETQDDGRIACVPGGALSVLLRICDAYPLEGESGERLFVRATG